MNSIDIDRLPALREIEEVLRGARARKSRAELLLVDPHYFNNNKERLENQIHALQSQLDDLLRDRDGASALIEECNRRIKELTQLRVFIKNKRKIKQFLKLQQQAEDLSNGPILGDRTA